MNRILKNSLLLTSFCGPLAALAADGAHGHSEIPWMTIVSQAVNLGLLVLLLVYLTRKTVARIFRERKQMYLDLVEKADAAKNEAEKNRREIAQRLQELESTPEQAINQARVEAEEMHKKVLDDARELAKKTREESERAAQFELERAKIELREELLSTAVEAARKILRDQVGGPEQKKLQSEFVEKIQVVR